MDEHEQVYQQLRPKPPRAVADITATRMTPSNATSGNILAPSPWWKQYVPEWIWADSPKAERTRKLLTLATLPLTEGLGAVSEAPRAIVGPSRAFQDLMAGVGRGPEAGETLAQAPEVFDIPTFMRRGGKTWDISAETLGFTPGPTESPIAAAIRIGRRTYAGKAGELHADIIDRYGLPSSTMYGPEAGFVTKSGKFISRNAAAAARGKTGELGAEDLLRKFKGE